MDLVKSKIKPNEKVLVLLDSNHTKAHVLDELECYHSLVTKDSWIVATDGIMSMVAESPRGQIDWKANNPSEAAKQFLKSHPEFILQTPNWRFNESELTETVTHWPEAWLKKIK